MIILKIMMIAFFIFAWLRSRKSRTVEVSDFFILSFLVIYIPGFLFHSSGETALNALHMPASAVSKAEIGLTLILALGAMVLTLRYYVERKIPSLQRSNTAISSSRLSVILGWSAGTLSLIFFFALLLSPEFRDFKLNVLKFLTFQFEGSEYRVLRNVGYNSWLIEGALGRVRFTIFPILFCLVIYPFLKTRFVLVAIIVASVFFTALPASLSKLPVFLFAGYVAIIAAARIPRLLDIGWISIMAIVALSLVVTVLIFLYVAQYQSSVLSGAVNPLNLAIERLWGEPYSVIVRYFTVYPGILPYTGWDGIYLVARLLGSAPRYPDIEVAQTLLGSDSGSNPGAFFLGGYAAFGMMGLCIFAVLGTLVLWGLDIVGRKIKTSPLRATYLAVVGMNTLFLNQISLQTALVTYGLAVVPAIIFMLDRAVVVIWQWRTAGQIVEQR